MNDFRLLFLVLVLAACGTQSTSSRTNAIVQTEPNELGVRAVHKSIYSLGEMVIISVENTKDTLVYLYQPNQLNVQKKTGDSTWKDIRVIACPCGAPCAPPRYHELYSMDQIDLHWDQRESWCELAEGEEMPRLKTRECEPGVYRLVLIVNDSGEQDQVDNQYLKVEFRIN